MEIKQYSKADSCGCTSTDSLWSVSDAIKRALSLIRPISGNEDVALADALGRVLAQPVKVQNMTPPFDCSAMDGFALRHQDWSQQTTPALRIQDQISAGDGRRICLENNAAIRIFTGAPMPLGADTVVMQEHTVSDTGHVQILQELKLGDHVRYQGEDMQIGATIMSSGCRIRPCEIAAIAAAGQGTVSVKRRPRVALLVSGNEVTATGGTLAAGQIWDVNTPMLLTTLQQAGADVTTVTVNDDENELARQLKVLAQTSDLIVTTGGVSVGNSDYQRPAFLKAGGEIHISGVAMKPGKPVCVGTLANAVWLGLPGNPLSAYVTWQVIGDKLLSALQGVPRQQSRRKVLSQNPLLHKAGRREYRPARIVAVDACGLEVIACLPAVQSAQLTPLIDADGLIVIPEQSTTIATDEPIEFVEFSR